MPQLHLTKHARQAFACAQEEAKTLHADNLSTEHFLLGLLQDEDTIAVYTLKRLNIDHKALYQEVKQHCSAGNSTLTKYPPLAPHSKRVIDFACEEVYSLSDDFFGTEHFLISTGHFLLGMLREKKGLAGRILASRGVRLKAARQAVKIACQIVPEPLGESDPASVWPPPISRPELEPEPPKLPTQSRRITFGSIFSAFVGQCLRPKSIEEEP